MMRRTYERLLWLMSWVVIVLALWIALSGAQPTPTVAQRTCTATRPSGLAPGSTWYPLGFRLPSGMVIPYTPLDTLAFAWGDGAISGPRRQQWLAFRCTAEGIAARYQPVKWWTSDSTVATVSRSGLVTWRKPALYVLYFK